MNPIPLSPIDHIFTGIGSYPIEFVFAYDEQIDAERLLESLENVLASFGPAKSQIVNEEGRFIFKETDPGFSFEVLESATSFDETDDRELFIDPVSTQEGEVLTRIRLTQTPKGSVLGVSISHCVVDGFSYFYFLTCWAKAFHEKSFYPPDHDRNILIKNDQASKQYSAEDIREQAGLFLEHRRSDVQRDKLVWETIQMPSSELKAMLTEAQEDCQVRLSFNDVIVASLWKKYILKWAGDRADRISYISCPFDYRRLIDYVPLTYFGNAVALITTAFPIEMLADAKISDLAIMVRKSIGSVSEEYIHTGLKALYGLNQNKGLSVNEHLHVSHPESGLLVTNLSRLPVKDIEFNAGPPVKYEILTPANRGAVILPSADGVEVRVCCPYE